MSYQFGQNEECELFNPITGECMDYMVPEITPETTEGCKLYNPYTNECYDQYSIPVPGTDPPAAIPEIPVPPMMPPVTPVHPQPPPTQFPLGVECAPGTPCANCNMDGSVAPFCFYQGTAPPVAQQCPPGTYGYPPYCAQMYGSRFDEAPEPPGVCPPGTYGYPPYCTAVPKPGEPPMLNVCPEGQIGYPPHCYVPGQVPPPGTVPPVPKETPPKEQPKAESKASLAVPIIIGAVSVGIVVYVLSSKGPRRTMRI